MKKQVAIVTFEVSTSFAFTDAADLEQQICDLKIELEAAGVDVESANYKCEDEDDEEESDEE